MTKLTDVFKAPFVGALACISAGNVLDAQERHHRTPFSYEFDTGGVTPTGGTASAGPYSASFMVGGGVSLPITKWVSWDLASLDFGFGTTNQAQTVRVNDGTLRHPARRFTRAPYAQAMFQQI